jgi:hypothetical protein
MSKKGAKFDTDSGHCFGKSGLERTHVLVEIDYVSENGWISPFNGECVGL